MRKSASLGPANDAPLAVTQELVALIYVENPTSIANLIMEPEFHAGLAGKLHDFDERRRFLWETGALAAHLIEIGGQS